MATYYVRADGTVTAANKANATSDAAASTSLNISEHNSCTFAAGDTIVISDAGGEYIAPSATLVPPTTGALGNRINYIASGSPLFSMYKLITGWTPEGTANVWEATWNDPDPRFISVDSSVGTLYSSGDLVSMDTNGDWAFSNPANKIYLYDDTNDPDTYNSPGVAGNWAYYAVRIDSDIGYTTIDGLRGSRAYYGAFTAKEPQPGITFSNCIGEYSYKGFVSGDTATGSYSDLTIEDCIGRYNQVHGINPGWRGTNVTLRRSKAHGNGWTMATDWMSGIKSFDDSGVFSGYDCYENESYENGYDNGTAQQGDGVGIWLDYTQGTTGANKIHHNYVHDNIGVGIFLEICKNSHAYCNVVHDNAATNVAGQSAANIVIDTRLGFISSDNFVYNNTVVGGRGGIKVDAYAVGACKLNDNIVKNNIAVGCSVFNLRADHGGQNNITNGSGNIYEANCFGAEAEDFLWWGLTHADTYAEFKAAHGESWDQVAGDPSFTNAVSHDYTLKSDSPCIDAGINLGSPFNIALMPGSSWPSGVVTGDQDDY